MASAIPTHLVGGASDPVRLAAVLRPFIDAAAGREGPVACVVVQGADGARDARLTGAALARASGGALPLRPLVVAPGCGPRAEQFDGVSGVLVVGRDALAGRAALFGPAGDAAWLEPLRAGGIPYAGIGAGAALAANTAVLAGWRIAARAGRTVAICDERAAGGAELLALRPGLGLVPFAVDVGASSHGTAGRLLHAMRLGFADEGWAIDEHTAVEVADGVATVHGDGSAYRLRRVGGRVETVVLGAGDAVEIERHAVPHGGAAAEGSLPHASSGAVPP